MFILYIDDSGSVRNPGDQHFVLAGFAVFERQIYHLINDIEKVVDSFNLGASDQIELHGSPMYTGKTMPWRGIASRDTRSKMIGEALDVLCRASKSVKAFGVVVEKKAITSANPVEYAFEEICNRFDLFLSRLYQSRGGRDEDKQKGLIVMDQSHYEQPLQALARDFRVKGTRWGHMRNIAEVPLFVDSRASRLIQLADLIAFSMWRKYEYQDGRFFDPIISRFDADGGVIHGLVHYRSTNRGCYCPACMSRSLNTKNARDAMAVQMGSRILEHRLPSPTDEADQAVRSTELEGEIGADETGDVKCTPIKSATAKQQKQIGAPKP